MEYFKRDNNSHSISFTNQNEAKCIKLVEKRSRDWNAIYRKYKLFTN